MAISDAQRNHDDDWRPLDEFIGQKQIVGSLKFLVDIAKTHNDPLLHVLLYGPPGIGKTTLAHLLAKEMGGNIRVTSGSSVERSGDLAAILTNLRENDMLLIQDIDRLRKVEDFLYPTMEDFVLHVVIGKGLAEKRIWLNLPRFTIIGTTTRRDLLTDTLTSCFGAKYPLDFYGFDEMLLIVTRLAALLNIPIDDDQTHDIARRSQGTPYTALRLLKWLG